LTDNAFNRVQIHCEPLPIYGQSAIFFRTTVKSCSRSCGGIRNLGDDARSGRPGPNDLAGPMRSMLQETSFLSYRVLSRHVVIASLAFLWILHQDSGSEKSDLRRFARPTPITEGTMSFSFSGGSRGFAPDQQYSVEHIITRDKSWFVPYSPSDAVLVQSRDEFPGTTRQTIDSEKLLSSIA
jgi:hypothetical protein